MTILIKALTMPATAISAITAESALDRGKFTKRFRSDQACVGVKYTKNRVCTQGSSTCIIVTNASNGGSGANDAEHFWRTQIDRSSRLSHCRRSFVRRIN